MTTHWECAERFCRQFPDIEVDTDAIYLRDGPLITAAGVTAGIDLALALVEEDHGRHIAMITARYMVVFLRRPSGQSQFSAHLVGQMAETSVIQKAQAYILANIAHSLSVDNVAHAVGMSARNFARVFRRDVGMTPADFVAVARIDAARRLLEDTTQPLQRIAASCGFADMNTMRRLFAKTIGVTPAAYRSRFHNVNQTNAQPASGRAARPALAPHARGLANVSIASG
uniref:AraC-like protein n=1 Tax=Azorhizobium caulinodans TaxID=7 RepID=Q43970_AZOCA|nr:AraC-like protein [Azorhizobium caulinodans ORS 571]